MLPDESIRSGCKAAIEALELWLRRVIEISLRPDFGDDYINAQINGQYILRRDLRNRISTRWRKSPEKYMRLIDAALIEDEVYIVCHPKLYKKYFRSFFEYSYPHGSRDQIRFFLTKLVEPRNRLMHSNPISVRQAEQVICYSYDTIESIKHYITRLNMGKEYNAPRIVHLSDSNGCSFHGSQIVRNNTGRGHVHVTEATSVRLRAGDRLSIEMEVDPSFSANDYRIRWTYENPSAEHDGYRCKRITIDLRECHVRKDFTVYCTVTAINQSWHRCGDVDDSVGLTYKILPPL